MPLTTLSKAELALTEPATILTELPSALVMVDCQNRFACELDVDGQYQPLPVVSRIEELLATARAVGVPRFYVTVGSHRNGPYNGANDTAPWLRRITDISGITDPSELGHPQREIDQAIVSSLAPEPGEVWVMKQRFSGFYETGLEIALRSAGVEALVICGVASYGCIYTSVLDANMRGFFAFVPADATMGANPRLHDAAMTLIGDKNVVDVATVNGAWTGAALKVPAGAGT
ncbi:MAG: isochorismatase [Blastococcus sp.]|jgi:nicotinamidase-related amidase|nr:isochorismatase [Blastococcus sp.]